MPRIQSKAPLQDRLMLEAMRLKDEANQLPPRSLRDARIRKARQAVMACHVSASREPPPNEWTAVVGSKSQEVSNGRTSTPIVYRIVQAAGG